MDLPDFIQIPRPIMEDKSLTQLDWVVYGLVYWYARLKLQKCVLSNASFAQLSNSHPRSVQRSLARLEERGYISCEYNSDMTEREIHPLVVFSKNIPTTAGSPPHDRRVTPPRPLGHPNKIDLIRESNKNIIPPYIPPKGKKKFSSLKDIDQEVLLDIAKKYNVPIGLVELNFEKMKAWLESNGKVKKDYRATLRGFVLRDISQVGIKRLENKKEVVDATGVESL